jgi:predicted MPP superfamily phosphohydrolase
MHSYRTQVKHVSVTLSRVPEYWKNKKAVLFSDSHLGHVRNIGFIRKVVKLINAQQPDIVFIPGDFYDGPPANHVELAAELKNLQSTHGTYFAMGNHEEFRDKSVFLNALKQAGVRVLDNEKVDIQGLQIIGLDYFDTVWSARQAQILNSLFIDRSRPSILLKHVPSHIEVAESAGISLQLSGHTHLGQMFPIGYITKQVYKGFHYGLQGYKTMQILTTSGVGTWGPPQRIGTNSEIVVLSFK